jgi:hypothetical protein
LAAGTAALALALPVASASAATIPPAPVFPTVSFPTISSLFTPGSLPCQLLDRELSLARQTGNNVWTNVVTNVFSFTGCGGTTG